MERFPSFTEAAPEESAPPPQESSERASEALAAERKGFVDRIRELINSRVQESKLPTKEGLGYESTMGIYGGKLAEDPDGKLTFDTRGLWSRIDQWGDRLLRTFDEHHARMSIRMAFRHPKMFLNILPFLADSKRYRGTPEQTMENVRRFGLEDFYGEHPWGIEMKQPEVLKRSIGLQDVFRQDLIKSPVLDKVDRFDAEAKAVQYMKELHDRAGGIAEGNAYSFLFTEHDEQGNVGKPVLMISSVTEVYNPDKNISDIEQRATDLLDFLASVGGEEWRRTKDPESVERVLDIALRNYGDPKVIKMVASYARRGRLTLAGDSESLEFERDAVHEASRAVFAAHNTQRLAVPKETAADLRRKIIEVCDSFTALDAPRP